MVSSKTPSEDDVSTKPSPLIEANTNQISYAVCEQNQSGSGSDRFGGGKTCFVFVLTPDFLGLLI